MKLNDFGTGPIAWDKGKKDYNIAGNVAILQLIHEKRFEAPWIEYHHPRLTRVFYQAVKEVPGPRLKSFDIEELKTIMFSWM